MKSAEEIIQLYVDNPYVEYIEENGSIHYTYECYKTLHDKIVFGEMDRLEAYASLGFDIDVVGMERAKQAAYRAVKMGKKIIRKDPADYDATLSIHDIIEKAADGEYDKDDLIANLISHSIYLEEIDRSKKK